MGEDRDTAQARTQDRVTIQEAAKRLGVKEDAIRKRIHRGTLKHKKTPEGRVHVWVDSAQDASQDAYRDAPRELVEELREHLEDLRTQLEAEREANRENRRIIAALTSRIPEIESPAQAPTEPPEVPTGATERPGS